MTDDKNIGLRGLKASINETSGVMEVSGTQGNVKHIYEKLRLSGESTDLHGALGPLKENTFTVNMPLFERNKNRTNPRDVARIEALEKIAEITHPIKLEDSQASRDIELKRQQRIMNGISG